MVFILNKSFTLIIELIQMKIILIVLALTALCLTNRNNRQVIIISRDDFQLTVLLQEQTLQIQLENVNSKEIFGLDITHESLKENEFLSPYFLETAEIFSFISKNLIFLGISKLGLIEFQVPVWNKAENFSLTIQLNSKLISQKKEESALTVGDFELIMYLEAESLVFKMENTITLDSFRLKLSSAMMKQDGRLSIFQQPIKLLKYLTQFPNNLNISEEGVISVLLKVGDETTAIVIKTNKIEMLEKDLLRKSLRIIKNLKSQKKKTKEQQQKCQSIIDEDEKRDNFLIDFNDKHYYFFDKINRLKKRIGNETMQTVFGKQLNSNSTFTFKVKQVNVAYDTIMYGVGSNRIRGKDDGHELTGDCALYCSLHPGYLYPGQNQLSTGGVQNGEVIEITIDTGKYEVAWKKNGSVLATLPIPEKIRNEPLFPVIMMYNVGDEIEFV